MSTAALPSDTARAGAVERILAAAAALFSERGFDAVSVNEIAARAGVSKANVFHHFDSKNALYLAVLRDACRDSTARLDRLVSESGPLAERLAEFAENQLKHMLDECDVSRLVLRELLKDGERRGRELAEKVYGDNFARLVAVLRAGQAHGELRADVDPAMIATALIGAQVFFFEAQGVLRHFPDVSFARAPARYSRMLVDILLHGTAAVRAGASRKE